MPYIINRYNGEELTILEDGTINSSTSLGLIGKNYFGYGEQQNENFVFLLENFANINPPSRPISGQLWFDTSKNLLNVYNGDDWISASAAIVSDSAPENRSSGTLWLKQTSGELNIWDGTKWSKIGPETVEGFGETKATSTILVDTANNQRPVILFKVNGITVAIASSSDFVIKSPSPVAGFASLVAGITLSTSFKIRSEIDGTASRAKKLEVSKLINGIPFDGQSDITVRANTPNKLTPGNYITGDFFDGSSPEIWNINASSANQSNKLVARNDQGNFSAGIITATLNGNVLVSTGTSTFNIISATEFIGGSLSGNAATASKLATARKINDVNFDGTADITVTADARTLTGSFINSEVTISNLQQLGTLQSLSVSDTGIVVGDPSQKLKIQRDNNVYKIFSETGLLRLGGSSSAELTILNVSTAVSQGIPSGQSAIIPTATSNIGTPSKRWKGVYAENLYVPTLNPADVNGTITVNGNLDVVGNFTVQGVVTSVNSTDIFIEDKLITVAAGSENNEQADGAGIEVAGSIAKLFYSSLGDKWNINKSLDAGVNDFLTTGLFRGTATSARYADLAENYLADRDYEPGTVLEFGGDKEVTIAQAETSRVAGVVSKNPAYLMNSECTGKYVVPLALQGRVFCKIQGSVTRGDMLISAGNGFAKSSREPKIGTIIGKSLEDFSGNYGTIEIVVGRV
jgi:hypothetical protein